MRSYDLLILTYYILWSKGLVEMFDKQNFIKPYNVATSYDLLLEISLKIINPEYISTKKKKSIHTIQKHITLNQYFIFSAWNEI